MRSRTTAETGAADVVAAQQVRAEGDIEALAASWDRHLAAENKSPATRKIYLFAVQQHDAYLHDQGMPVVAHAVLWQQGPMSALGAASGPSSIAHDSTAAGRGVSVAPAASGLLPAAMWQDRRARSRRARPPAEMALERIRPRLMLTSAADVERLRQLGRLHPGPPPGS
jgi:hypothetical protein